MAKTGHLYAIKTMDFTNVSAIAIFITLISKIIALARMHNGEYENRHLYSS